MADQRYKVIERIDAGGMAEVFKANATSLDGFEKLVAIKRILPNLTQNERFVRMFLDEAKVSLHLNHTNCVHVFDLGIADGTYFIVMEYVDGTNLKKLIEFLHKNKQPMAVEQAVFVAIEVCKGLTHAHEKRDQQGNSLDIVHRDISPPNILISQAGECKITDFGLAKAKSQAEVTDPGVVKGKFGYLSPEAAHGEDIDSQTDVFALGILLWEMLAGRRLFLGDSDYATLQQVRKADIPSIRGIRNDVPPELEKVMMRALARERSDRFQNAHQMAEALAEFLFAYGRVVTSYDIAELVKQLLNKRPKRAKTAHDEAVGNAIQQQLDQLKSLEQIDDLDMYMAQNYDSLPDEGEVSDGDGDGNFEDPRMWADLGFGGEPPADVDVTPMQQAGGSGDKASWEEAGLDDLARSTSAYKAIDPASVATQEAAKQASAQPGGPPTLPGATRAPVASNGTANQVQSPQTTPSSGQPQANGASVAKRTTSEETSHQQQSEISKGDASSSTGLSAIGLTIIVAIVVVLVGAGTAFALGLIPPS